MWERGAQTTRRSQHHRAPGRPDPTTSGRGGTEPRRHQSTGAPPERGGRGRGTREKGPWGGTGFFRPSKRPSVKLLKEHAYSTGRARCADTDQVRGAPGRRDSGAHSGSPSARCLLSRSPGRRDRQLSDGPITPSGSTVSSTLVGLGLPGVPGAGRRNRQVVRSYGGHRTPPPSNGEDEKTQIINVQRCHSPIAEPAPPPAEPNPMTRRGSLHVLSVPERARAMQARPRG